MSTTKELKVRKSLPYNINIRANGKYDYTTTHTFKTDNEQLSYEMQNYDGLKYTLNTQGDVGTPILDFSETVLPWKFEMNNYLARTRYCWKPYREEPYQVEILKQVPTNYNIVGTPTFNGNIVSGFNSSNYLTLKKPFKPQGAWEIVLKFKMNEAVGREQGLFGYNGTGLFKICLGGNNRMILSLSTVDNDWNIGEITGTTDIELNKFYWVKAEFTGSVYKLSLSIDGIEYNLEGTLETSSIPVFPDTTYLGVVNRNYNSLAGSIDLSESYIKLDEVVADSTDENAELIEYAFTQPTLSENGTMGGSSFAVSADNETNGSMPAYYAFDNSTSTYWRGGNIPGYIEFYNPSPINVTAITWGFFYSYPTSGNVQGSNDYSDWTTITEFTNDSASDFTIDMSGNTNSYKYYRINVSAVNMDVIHCNNLTIVGTVKGYAVEKTYKLNEKIYALDLIRNYTVNGSPIINDGIASEFSYYNYLSLKEPFKPLNNPWEINLKITTPSSFGLQRMIGSVGSYYRTIGGEVSANNTLGFGITSNGYSWDIGWMGSSTVLEPNVPYWIRLSFTGSEYKFELSSNGIDYNLENSIQSSTPIFQSDDSIINLGFHGDNSYTYFRGSIDLNECYIKYNDKTIRLYGTVTEELYGIIDGEEYSVYLPSYCYVNKDQNLIVRQNKIEKINDITDWYLGVIMKKHPGYDLDV